MTALSAADPITSSATPSANLARQLQLMHDIAALLAGQQAIDDVCRGFLRHVMDFSGASGGTVRILDAASDSVHIIVHEGISEAMIDAEHCIRTDACLCGAVIEQGVILVHDFRDLPSQLPNTPAQQAYRCEEEGFVSIAVLPIIARQTALGSYSLHFAEQQIIGQDQQRLLETLGRNLGVAIDNQRLIARERQFAVAQERSLLAEGLHDSIAQSLNFISMQVQMLDGALQRGSLTEAAGVLPLLRIGVEESYQDVRELLVNFRSRWQGDDLAAKVDEVLAKFQAQSGIACTLGASGNGAPLAPGQQLQVLFILQEALSNIRKHASASQVLVQLENGRDLLLRVRDDGHGFAPASASDDDELHIGLRIMQERAERLGAALDIASIEGEGTTITLLLTRGGRQAA